MMLLHRVIALSLVVTLAAFASACSTVIKPTRPSDPLEVVGDVDGVRFDGENVQLREPGMPLSNSRAWQREVRNYTASTLNDMLQAPDVAPTAETIVVFDLAGPSAIQLGTWKEMTVELTTTLPNGQVVRSEPVTQNIDDPIEYFAVSSMTVVGSALDVVAAIASLVFVFGSVFPPLASLGPYACGCFIGSLCLGLSLNIGQSLATYLVAGSEETRWSNLFAKALTQHAQDIEMALKRAPPPEPRPLAPPAASPLPPPPAPSSSPGGAPPPPVLDPADEKEEAPPPPPVAPPAAAPSGSTAF